MQRLHVLCAVRAATEKDVMQLMEGAAAVLLVTMWYGGDQVKPLKLL